METVFHISSLFGGGPHQNANQKALTMGFLETQIGFPKAQIAGDAVGFLMTPHNFVAGKLVLKRWTSGETLLVRI